MYRGSLQVLLKIRPIVLTGALFLLSVEISNQTHLFDHFELGFLFIPLASYFGFKTTEGILNPEPDDHSYDQAMFSRFYWRFFGLTLPLFIAYILVYRSVPDFATVFRGGLSGESLAVVLALISYFIVCFLFLIQFSFFGLKLPEAVAGEINRRKTSLKLKPKYFWLVFSRLLIGPVFISSVGVIVNYSAHAIHPELRYLLLDAWIPNVFGIALFLFCLFMQIWAVVMTFWILAQTYIRIEYGEKGMQVIYRY